MHTLRPPQLVPTLVTCHFLHMDRNIKGFMAQTGDPTGERWAWPTLRAAGVGWCMCVYATAQGRGRADRASGGAGLRMSSMIHSRYAFRSVPLSRVKWSVAVPCSTPGEG